MSESDLQEWVNKMASRLRAKLRTQGYDITQQEAFDALRETLTVGDVLTYISEQKKAA